MKKAQEDTSLEKIEGIVDDMQEAVDVQAEIAGIISSPLKGTEDDNEALEKELTDLLEDDVTTDLISELEKLHVVGMCAGGLSVADGREKARRKLMYFRLQTFWKIVPL